MYQSIVQYYNEMLIEKYFKQLVTYTDHRLNQKDMNEEALNFYKRKTLRKMLSTANELSLIGVADADHMRTQMLQSKVLDALKAHVSKRLEKKQKDQQAVLFSDIMIKSKVLRALALHNLEMQ